jgi:hypothetical protein
MSFEHEKREARRLLGAIEDGRVSTADTYHLAVDADPALLHLLFGWLRAHYPSSHSASDGVLGRLGALCTEYPKVARRARTGESDSIVAWFEETHSYREFGPDRFIDLVVDKLES